MPEATEACDDGNSSDGDGCRNDCTSAVDGTRASR
jgi:cysteine-rich repeat protein